MIAIDRSLRVAGGRIRGVVTARLLLALLLLSFQSIQVSDTYNAMINSPLWILVLALPAAVFTLSGFLLAQSATHLSTREYLLRRARRILPPLAIAILFIATVVGPTFTSSSLRDYASDETFRQFFLNIFGVPQYSLPGVFEFNNLSSNVHSGFWMLPYIFLTPILIKFLAAPQNATIRLSAAIALIATAALAFHFVGLFQRMPLPIQTMLRGPGLMSLLCALLGTLSYTGKRFIRLDGRIFTGAAAAIGAVAVLGNQQWINQPLIDLLLAVAVGYATIYLMFNLPRGPAWLSRYNLSYGIFLYGFPIQQAWMQIGDLDLPWGVNLLLTLPIVVILAGTSWFAVERRTSAAGFADRSLISDAKPHHVAVKPLIRRSGDYVRQIRSAIPVLIISSILLAIIFGILLMTMLAFQPEAGGA